MDGLLQNLKKASFTFALEDELIHFIFLARPEWPRLGMSKALCDPYSPRDFHKMKTSSLKITVFWCRKTSALVLSERVVRPFALDSSKSSVVVIHSPIRHNL
jgi:hypothetical protein